MTERKKSGIAGMVEKSVVKTDPPKWAIRLLNEAVDWWCSLGHEKYNPTLNWKVCNCSYSCGNAEYNDIFVHAGTDRLDAKYVVLHELAHIFSPPREVGKVNWSVHHDDFWDTAWMLFRWAKLPIKYCKQRTGEYRKGAIRAYERGLRHEINKS